LSEEEQPGKNQVVVLSYDFWQKNFGGDRRQIGKTITLDGAPYTVVGVMPPEFKYPARTEMWTPLLPNAEAASDRAYRYLRLLGRLKPGGRLVVNAITLENAADAYQAFRRRGLVPEVTLLQVARAEPLAHYLRYEALNPIQIFAVEKPRPSGEAR